MPTAELSPDTTRILRHLLAAIAYRASRSLRDAPDGFQSIRLANEGMSAAELLLHMTNVLSFALATVAHAERVRHDPVVWDVQVERFYVLLGELDSRLAEGVSLEMDMELTLVQGPLADVLTHVGQLHAMRRLAGSPVPPTNYIRADVQIGRTALNDQFK